MRPSWCSRCPSPHLETNYPQINGRGYPDTVLDDVDTPPDQCGDAPAARHRRLLQRDAGSTEPLNNGEVAQDMGSAITVDCG